MSQEIIPPMKVLIIDGEGEKTLDQWIGSGCLDDSRFELSNILVGYSIHQVLAEIDLLQPNAVLIGYGLGISGVTGVDMIRAIRANGYDGFIVINSAGDEEHFNDVKSLVNAVVAFKSDLLLKGVLTGLMDGSIQQYDDVNPSEILRHRKPAPTEELLIGIDYEKIIALIEEENIDQVYLLIKALQEIKGLRKHSYGDSFVQAVLVAKKSSPQLICDILDAFIGLHDDIYGFHGDWVHSLSHFIKVIWEKRNAGSFYLDEYIGKFNSIVFEGACKTKDINCADRILQAALNHITPSDIANNLEVFFLAEKQIGWIANMASSLDWMNLDENVFGDDIRNLQYQYEQLVQRISS